MKMAKKVLAVLLSVLFVVGVFTACSSNSGDTKKKEDTTNSATSKLKVGFIFLHDKNSTYDLNFIKAADAACKKLGITGAQKLYKTQIPEGQERRIIRFPSCTCQSVTMAGSRLRHPPAKR